MLLKSSLYSIDMLPGSPITTLKKLPVDTEMANIHLESKGVHGSRNCYIKQSRSRNILFCSVAVSFNRPTSYSWQEVAHLRWPCLPETPHSLICRSQTFQCRVPALSACAWTVQLTSKSKILCARKLTGFEVLNTRCSRMNELTNPCPPRQTQFQHLL